MMKSLDIEEQFDLVRRLVRATDNGKLEWEQSPESEFAGAAEVGAFRFLLRSTDDDGAPPFALTVMRRLSPESWVYTFELIAQGGSPVDGELVHLYRLAERQWTGSLDFSRELFGTLDRLEEPF